MSIVLSVISIHVVPGTTNRSKLGHPDPFWRTWQRLTNDFQHKFTGPPVLV